MGYQEIGRNEYVFVIFAVPLSGCKYVKFLFYFCKSKLGTWV